jgi:hypothetical protein
MTYFWFFNYIYSLDKEYQEIKMLFSIKKSFLIIAIMLSSLALTFAEDDEIKIENETQETSITSENSQESDSMVKKDTIGYFAFLENCIGCNISVIIRNVDSSVIGNLQAIYKDGILLETSFNSTIFIPKDSIAYVKISKMNKK